MRCEISHEESLLTQCVSEVEPFLESSTAEPVFNHSVPPIKSLEDHDVQNYLNDIAISDEQYIKQVNKLFFFLWIPIDEFG